MLHIKKPEKTKAVTENMNLITVKMDLKRERILEEKGNMTENKNIKNNN